MSGTTKDTECRERTCVGYVRVSTTRQAEFGISLERQESQIRAWASEAGYELLGIHCDHGSGKSRRSRAAFSEALRKAVEVPGRALVAYSMSRVARDTQDMLTLAGDMERSGTDIVCLKERIDTSTPTGRLMFTIFAALNQMQREVTAENTAEALQFGRATMHNTCRDCGYVVLRDPGFCPRCCGVPAAGPVRPRRCVECGVTEPAREPRERADWGEHWWAAGFVLGLAASAAAALWAFLGG